MADITTIALDIFTYLLQPKICSRGGDFKQVAMVMVPEATVGKYHTAKFIKDKIRAEPKFYALIILKEVMKSREKQVVDFFIKKHGGSDAVGGRV